MSYNTLGERIKYHRKRLGLTQEQLADRLGVSAQAVSKWENNQSCPDISILPEIADLFGITVDELLGKEQNAADAVHEAEVVEETSKDMWSFKTEKRAGGILFALYIITVGALLAVNEIFGFSVSWWTVLWTLGLFYIGVSGLVGRFSAFSLMLALAGAYFLTSAYDLLPLNLGWNIVIPAALVLWGLSLLADILCNRRFRRKKLQKAEKKSGKAHHECTCAEGYLHCEMNFGDYRTVVRTAILRGGSVEANFGDFTVDFSGCDAIAPDCSLKVENNFGSLTLLIPRRFRLTLNQDSGVACTVDQHGEPNEETEGTVHIELETHFGSCSIRYID